MADNVKHVPGKNAGHIMLYALSTCDWKYFRAKASAGEKEEAKD